MLNSFPTEPSYVVDDSSPSFMHVFFEMSPNELLSITFLILALDAEDDGTPGSFPILIYFFYATYS